MDVKVEVKDRSCFLDFHSENEKEFFTKDVKKVKTETVISGSDCHIHIKTEVEEEAEVSKLCSLDQREFSSEDPVMGYSKSEIDTKIEIKEEQRWLQTSSTETACSYDVKDEDFPPVTSSGLCTRVSCAACSKSPLIDAEVPTRGTNFYDGKDNLEYEHQKSVLTEIPTAEEHILSEKPAKCTEGEEIYIRPLHLKQKTLTHQAKRPHKCNICDKSFTWLSHLKAHRLCHKGKKPHQCKICDGSFTRPSDLKRHSLIHQGKKSHQCKTCHRSFTYMSDLKRHNLGHEGKKPHQCKTCDKSFTRLSSLKTHNLIHESKRPHKCKTCDKSFTQLSNLKTHDLVHEGKKPYQCKTCDKSFTHYQI